MIFMIKFNGMVVKFLLPVYCGLVSVFWKDIIYADDSVINIAYGKPTSQYPGTYCDPKWRSLHNSGCCCCNSNLAVDGDINTCSLTTGNSTNSYGLWLVDFEGPYFLNSIKIYQHEDIDFRKQFHGFTVYGFPPGGNRQKIYHDTESRARDQEPIISIRVPLRLRNVTFSRLSIYIHSHKNANKTSISPLTLCEVQIFTAPSEPYKLLPYIATAKKKVVNSYLVYNDTLKTEGSAVSITQAPSVVSTRLTFACISPQLEATSEQNRDWITHDPRRLVDTQPLINTTMRTVVETASYPSGFSPMAGGLIGTGLALVTLLTAILVFIFRRYKRRKTNEASVYETSVHRESTTSPYTTINSCRNSVQGTTYEPHRDKSNKMACAPSEDSDQPGHPHESSLGAHANLQVLSLSE